MVLDSIFGLKLLPVTELEDFTKQSRQFHSVAQNWSECFHVTDPATVQTHFEILRGYMLYMGNTVVLKQLQMIENQNGGMFVTRTVKEHALGIKEPLLQLTLEPNDPRRHLHGILPHDESMTTKQPLCTSTADVEDDYWACERQDSVDAQGNPVTVYIRAPSTYYTGKGSVNKLGQFVKYHGVDQLSGTFATGPLQLDGAVKNRTNVHGMYGFGNSMQFPTKVTGLEQLRTCSNIVMGRSLRMGPYQSGSHRFRPHSFYSIQKRFAIYMGSKCIASPYHPTALRKPTHMNPIEIASQECSIW
jgi:hypothetical protein